MTKHWLIASLMLAAAAAGGPAQEKKKAEGPGPEHAALAKLAGEYTTVSRFRVKPGESGQESKGTAKLTSILGGRFLDEEAKGELMGQPTTSRHMYGYNAEAKKYEGSWVYSASTAIMTLTGKSADGGKTIELTGTFDQADGAKATLGITLKRIDDNSFTLGLSAKAPDGSPGPTLETTYMRKK